MKIRVFQSDKGDCLLLTSADGKNLLADGGQVNSSRSVDAYSDHVAAHLGRMRRRSERLDLVYVSHIDQDHIGGILRMLDDEFEWRVHDVLNQRGLPNVSRPDNPRPPEIGGIWHNAFHEQAALNEGDLENLLASSTHTGAQAPYDPEHRHNYGQSIGEAIKVSRRIGEGQLNIPLNSEFGGKLAIRRGDTLPVQLGDFTITVLGPTSTEISKLRKKWNSWLVSEAGQRQLRKIQGRAVEDETRIGNTDFESIVDLLLIGPAIGRRSSVSPPNVASLVLLVEEQGKNVLLTGDARDDHILDYLKDCGKTDANGHAHLDVLKIQHHGSENNYSVDFGKMITADHYVFCGNGKHENPDLRVVERVIDSRLGSEALRSPNPQSGDRFKLWFNASSRSEGCDKHHMEALEKLVRRKQRSSNDQMRYDFINRHSFSISL